MVTPRRGRWRGQVYCFIVDFDAVQHETRRLLDGTSQLVQWRRHIFEDVEDLLPL